MKKTCKEGGVIGLSLFSGVGGFEIAAEIAGLDVEWRWQIEVDEACRRVLDRHYPHADRSICDVTKARAEDFGHVDIIVGGFPCQDISVAGRGAGLAGERSGLWGEYARLVRDLRPRFVVVENVAALLVRGFDRVAGDLAACGYDLEWACVSAAAVGSPHIRDRLWIVAHTDGGRREGERRSCDDGGEDGQHASRPIADGRACARPHAADTDGVECRERHDADEERRWTDETEQTRMGGCDAADAESTRRGAERGTESRRAESAGSPGVPRGCGVREDVSDTESERRGSATRGARSGPQQDEAREGAPCRRGSFWTETPSPQPALRRSYDGSSEGLDPRGGGIDGDSDESRSDAALCGMQFSAGTQEVQRETGGQDQISFADDMRRKVHGSNVCQRHVARRIEATTNTEIPWALLRSVWGEEEPSRPSRRRESQQRFAVEYPDLVRVLSSHPPPPCASCWRDGSWADGISPALMDDGCTSRVDRLARRRRERERLKQLGNGIVPQAAAVAMRRVKELMEAKR